MSVIHLSFDYPDKIDNRKTKAVRNLILSQSQSGNIVFSLNRTATRLSKIGAQKEDHGYTFYIIGFPYGIFLFFWMFIAYRMVYKTIVKENIKPHLIHAHKLTFEGIIAFLLSKKLKIPYILTVRGDSDLHLLYYKRLYHRLYRRIIRSAERVIFLAPWTVKPIRKYFGNDVLQNKYSIIPNIVNITTHQEIEPFENKRFITVFHFKTYKRKNILRVIKAFDKVFHKYPDYALDIVGDGPNKDIIMEYIKKSGFPEKFNLKGEIENRKLTQLYTNYQGFILPSYPETFGLVFVEALSAGIPIIYSKNSAIDGYFNEFNVSISVNHRSVDEIAAAIETIIQNNNEYKRSIKQLISNGFFNQFSMRSVGEKYSRLVLPFSPSSA